MDDVGGLLRRWRSARRLSQEALAEQAEISQRHLSWLENGRARPSREMVLLLASALDVPLRERNLLLLAAGHAPAYRETELSAPALAPARRALEHLLRGAEPFGAVVMNRRWELVMANRPFRALAGLVLGRELQLGENLVALSIDPELLGRALHNREELARALILRVHRDAVATGDDELWALLRRLEAMPGVPTDWRRDVGFDTPPIALTVDLQLGEQRLSLFTTLTSLGTATDVSLAELHIEHYFPADDATEAILRAWPAA
jgi:transcriptional regulator with XRE-family HTH domain